MKYLLLISGVFACSSNWHFTQGYTTPQLLATVKHFESDFKTTIRFEVVFTRPLSSMSTPGSSGFCYKSGSFRRVEIDSQYSNSIFQDSIVYHELGHCALDLNHYEINQDIMNAVILITTSTFEKYRITMIDNYFNGIYNN